MNATAIAHTSAGGTSTSPTGKHRAGGKSIRSPRPPPEMTGKEARRRISDLGLTVREFGVVLGLKQRMTYEHLSRALVPIPVRLALALLARPPKDKRKNRKRPYKPRPLRAERVERMAQAEQAKQPVLPSDAAMVEPEFHHSDSASPGQRTHLFSIKIR
jgi:hypothetical protein